MAAIDVRTHIEAPMATLPWMMSCSTGSASRWLRALPGIQLLVAATVELQDNPKPACFVEVVLRFYG
ncbi:MAG TPA: hypothetical protein VI094_10575 [Propionibacteriaceae bacterium]